LKLLTCATNIIDSTVFKNDLSPIFFRFVTDNFRKHKIQKQSYGD